MGGVHGSSGVSLGKKLNLRIWLTLDIIDEARQLSEKKILAS
jgi:hypothetical protein